MNEGVGVESGLYLGKDQYFHWTDLKKTDKIAHTLYSKSFLSTHYSN